MIDKNYRVELSEDNEIAQKLELSLNGYLTEAYNGDFSEKYVEPNQLKKFEFFFYTLSRIRKNTNVEFHNPIVLKSYTFDGESYFVTLSFTGTRDEKPYSYKIFEIKAVPFENHYRFYCVFDDRTENFKTKTFGSVTFHYSSSIDTEKAKKFADFKSNFAELTKTSDSTLDYYKFQSLDELLRSYGFLFDATKCNFLAYDLGFTDNEGKIYVTGTNNENYSFGYIGDYLYYNLPNAENIYGPFVRGLSTYFGGYGLSGENVEELKQQFRDELKVNPEIDFLEEFKKGRKSSVKRHFSYFVMSSFLCQEIIEKHNFDIALKLVYSGRKGEDFFSNLKKYLDIDESNFHETILRLIQK
ncbi:MAG: hypothetical protein DWQ06_11775 [Calditrichaeota bacterium]|nr:MAG: hypothetical protein DWQ06_11775 [Calditrichota bacterium]